LFAYITEFFLIMIASAFSLSALELVKKKVHEDPQTQRLLIPFFIAKNVLVNTHYKKKDMSVKEIIEYICLFIVFLLTLPAGVSWEIIKSLPKQVKRAKQITHKKK